MIAYSTIAALIAVVVVYARRDLFFADWHRFDKNGLWQHNVTSTRSTWGRFDRKATR